MLLALLLIGTNFYSYSIGKNAGESTNPLKHDAIAKKTPEEKKGDGKTATKEKETEFLDKKTMRTLEVMVKRIHGDYYKDVDNDLLNEGVLRGVAQSLKDPYTVFMTAEEYKDFYQSTEGKYCGVGIIVTPGDDGMITVVAPIKDTPAFKAGIKTGDKILKVDGVEFTADQMQDAVHKMRGEEGKEVQLTILRKGKESNDILDFVIKREIIKLETVDGRMLEKGLGYISISEFDQPTYKDFVAVYKRLKKEGMERLILDLRGNPGGLLNVCADVADLFLDKGVIVYTKYKNGEKDYYYSDNAKEEIPLVVLVNEGTASASEIVSGALQDRKRAKIIGTTTFGKGIVQRIFDLPDKQALKITVSEYFTPKDRNIHKKGIEPDIKVELNDDVKQIGPDVLDQDNQLQKAIEVIKGEK